MVCMCKRAKITRGENYPVHNCRHYACISIGIIENRDEIYFFFLFILLDRKKSTGGKDFPIYKRKSNNIKIIQISI